MVVFTSSKWEVHHIHQDCMNAPLVPLRVWCSVVWCGVVRVVQCGVVQCGAVWCGAV